MRSADAWAFKETGVFGNENPLRVGRGLGCVAPASGWDTGSLVACRLRLRGGLLPWVWCPAGGSHIRWQRLIGLRGGLLRDVPRLSTTAGPGHRHGLGRRPRGPGGCCPKAQPRPVAVAGADVRYFRLLS